MARASRRSNIAAMDGVGDDSDDEPVVRSTRKGRTSVAATPIASAPPSAPDSSDDEPVGPSHRAQRAKSKPPPEPMHSDEEEEDPGPPPPAKRGRSGAAPPAAAAGGREKSRRGQPDEQQSRSQPPSPKSRKLRRDDSHDAPSESVSPPATGPGSTGWSWITSRLFTSAQDEHMLERWEEIPLPSPNTRSLDTLARFRALCMKNTTKWVRGGIAYEKRAVVWELLSQVRVYGGRLETPINYYKSLVAQSSTISPKLKKDIRADITRTMQDHARFKTKAAQAELDRILSAYCVRNPTVGYCQSMSHVVGFLMLFYDEESVFWFLCTIVDQYLPADFYASSLLGVRIETEVFARLVDDKLGKLAKHLRRHEIDLRVVSLKWFMCFFLLTLPLETAARIWDVLLLEGAYVLHNFGLALLETYKYDLLDLDETSEILESLNKIGSRCHDADALVKKAMEKFAVKERDIVKMRAVARPPLEKEYVAQLQNMESRRAHEERERIRLEAARLQQEREEELALESGTSVLKVPRSAFGLWSHFSVDSRPKRVTIKLVRTRHEPPPKKKKARGIDADESDDEDNPAKKAPPPPDDWTLTWEGATSKSEVARTLQLNEVQLVLGATAGVFGANSRAREAYAAQDHLCASFLFPPDAGAERRNHSLDLIFDTRDQLDAWVKVLRRSNILRIKVTSTSTAAAATNNNSTTTSAVTTAQATKPDAAAVATPKKPPSSTSAPTPAPTPAQPLAPTTAADEDSGRDRSRRKRASTAPAPAPPVHEDEEEEEEAAPPPRRRAAKTPVESEDEFDVRDI